MNDNNNLYSSSFSNVNCLNVVFYSLAMYSYALSEVLYTILIYANIPGNLPVLSAKLSPLTPTAFSILRSRLDK